MITVPIILHLYHTIADEINYINIVHKEVIDEVRNAIGIGGNEAVEICSC